MMKIANSLGEFTGGSDSASCKAASVFLRQLVWGSALILFACIGLPAGAQAGEWVWMGGSNTAGQAGVYGTLGTPAAGNLPGSRRYASSWIDGSGDLWLFGGDGYDASGSENTLNDLWEFNSSTNEWTWMGGDNIVPCGPTGCSGYFGVYGTPETPATGNAPGGRYGATSWTDASGNLWLFGGTGYDANGNNGWLNDLWEYNTTSREWAWMAGSDTNTGSCEFGGPNFCAQPGVYSTPGTLVPAGRMGAVGWTDSNGNLWLFGGETMVEYGVDSRLNDLWEFNPSTYAWTFVGGTIPGCTLGVECDGTPSVYGTSGVPAAGNFPGARWFASSWTDNSGNLWLFGGEGILADDCGNLVNDLWRYSPSTLEWAWMGGGDTCYTGGGQPGVYGTLGTPASGNIPGSRKYAVNWSDSSGNLWLMGGWGYDVNGALGYLNDQWEYTPSTKEWTWMSGSDTVDQSGVYGTPGASIAEGIPGSRGAAMLVADSAGTAAAPGGRAYANSWTDSSGNTWLFGGQGYGASGGSGFLNDLWEYQLSKFKLGLSSTATTIQSGGEETITVTITPQNGFSSAVTFACSGLPSGASCSFNPATVTPPGSTSTVLTYHAQTLSAAVRPNSRPFLPETVLAFCVCLLGWRKRRGPQMFLLLAVTAAGLCLVSGCGSGGSAAGGGGGGGGVTPVTSTITVTATSGSIQQSTTISITVD